MATGQDDGLSGARRRVRMGHAPNCTWAPAWVRTATGSWAAPPHGRPRGQARAREGHRLTGEAGARSVAAAQLCALSTPEAKAVSQTGRAYDCARAGP
ncbi:hypothetical protein TNCT1_24760 [Streptomyces sp. 1-11]|nr:hypothetical protein TNCT1_24760 [Streptomyces sp. 1-11]